jgi:hypothetical protein
MKTIIIERVSNGWIVRPFSLCEAWTVRDSFMAVYVTMEELQQDLPHLLSPELSDFTRPTTPQNS